MTPSLYAACDFTVEIVTPDYVLLRDNNREGTQSLTNAAERIVRQMHERYPGRRVYYFDTMGRLDEMQHWRGVFLSFAAGGPT